MKYPEFLKKGDTITVFAPSAGIEKEKHEGFDLSLKRIKENGWKVTETASVRTGMLESADGKTREKTHTKTIWWNTQQTTKHS